MDDQQMGAPSPDEIVAKHGEKMIQVHLYFFTGPNLASEGHIRPKHAWAHGVAYTDRNTLHGIERHSSHFHTQAEIATAVEDVLSQAGVVLHASRKEKKYRE